MGATSLPGRRRPQAADGPGPDAGPVRTGFLRLAARGQFPEPHKRPGRGGRGYRRCHGRPGVVRSGQPAARAAGNSNLQSAVEPGCPHWCTFEGPGELSQAAFINFQLRTGDQIQVIISGSQGPRSTRSTPSRTPCRRATFFKLTAAAKETLAGNPDTANVQTLQGSRREPLPGGHGQRYIGQPGRADRLPAGQRRQHAGVPAPHAPPGRPGRGGRGGRPRAGSSGGPASGPWRRSRGRPSTWPRPRTFRPPSTTPATTSWAAWPAASTPCSARLAASRQQQAQLVSDAGHELRTPLTSLRTNIEVLMRDAGPAGRRPGGTAGRRRLPVEGADHAGGRPGRPGPGRRTTGDREPVPVAFAEIVQRAVDTGAAPGPVAALRRVPPARAGRARSRRCWNGP